MNRFHDWLIRQRRYCEYGLCMKRAETVRNVNGRDTVYCGWHGRSLSALRSQRTRKEKHV